MRLARVAVAVGVITLAVSAPGFSSREVPTPSRILFASDTTAEFGEHIDEIAVDATGLPRRLRDLGPGVWAAPSPDGRRIAFVQRRTTSEGLFVMDRNGTNQRQLMRETAMCSLLGSALYWSPDGRRIAFRCHGPKIGFAAADGSSVRLLEKGTALEPAWSPDGAWLAFASETGDLFVVDIRNGTRRKLGVGMTDPAWSGDGRNLAVVRAGQLVLVHVPSGRLRRLRRVPGLASSPEWSPDGRRIAFAAAPREGARGSLRLFVLQVSSGRVTRLTGFVGQQDFADDPLSWSPDGHRLAFVGYRGILHIVDSRRPGRVRRLSSWPPRRSAGPPRWLDGGRLIMATRVTENDREIYVVNRDGSASRALTTNNYADIEPSASPEGREIAFVSVRQAERRIYVMPAAGGQPRLLLARTFPQPQAGPAWSPTRAEIAFEARGAIYVVSTAGGRPFRVVSNGSEAAWSPDGNSLAFRATRGNRAGLWLVARDGTGLRPLSGFRRPSLAPDGMQFTFQRPVAFDRNGIFVADLQEGAGERLLAAPGRDPAWSPDGATIAYDTGGGLWLISPEGGQSVRVAVPPGSVEHVAWMP